MNIFISISCDLITHNDITFICRSIEYLHRINVSYKLFVGVVSDDEMYLHTGHYPILSWDERVLNVTSILWRSPATIICSPYICTEQYMSENRFSNVFIKSTLPKQEIVDRFPVKNMIIINVSDNPILTTDMIKTRVIEKSSNIIKDRAVIFFSMKFETISTSHIKYINILKNMFKYTYLICGIYNEKACEELNEKCDKKCKDRISELEELKLCDLVIEAPEKCDNKFLLNNSINFCIYNKKYQSEYYKDVTGKMINVELLPKIN